MEEKQKEISPKKHFWQKFAFISGIVLLVIAIAICGITIFQRTAYTPFWVNGQSMYPTLNKDAKYKDGTLIGEVRTRGEQDGIYDVDYGFMSTGNNTIKNLKRFEIIICKYEEKQTSYNIKRLIVLPGETFYIVNNPGKEDNGDLYIQNASGKFDLITQPLSKELVAVGEYNDRFSQPTTLKDTEIFVMGDNRKGTNSYDSRKVGPINKDYVLGVAVGLNGKATIGYNKEGVYGPISVSHYWPTFF